MKKNWMQSFAVIALLLMVLVGCAAAPQSTARDESAPSGVWATAAPEAAPMEEPVYDSETASSSPMLPGAQKRLVIQNARLGLVVEDPGKSMAEISALADNLGGFVVNSRLYKTTTRDGVEIPEADITIRVPAEKLNSALDTMRAMVADPNTDVLEDQISGQDVTQDYTDAKSRLVNLEAAEKQLQKIMDEAKKTEDVLEVFNQLVYTREQIEVLKGQIKYFEEAAALSAVSINLKAEAGMQPIQIGGWKPQGVARDAVQALINTLQFLGTALIWIVIYFLPILVLIIIGILILRAIILAIFKRRKTKAAATPEPKPQEKQE